MLWFAHDQILLMQLVLVHYDSQSAINLSKNAMFQSRSKHIEVRYLWIRLVVEK